MLFFVLASLRVLVLENEVDLSHPISNKFIDNEYKRSHLVCGTAFVGTKHDDIRRGIGKFLSVELLVVLKELHVGATTLQTV